MPVHAEDALATWTLAPPPAKPEVYERAEMAVSGMPEAANPFDPEAVALDVEITPPSGKAIRVPGFFGREFERRLEGRREVLQGGADGWRIRWMALEPWPHTLVATATLAGKVVARGQTVADAVPGQRHGLARVRSRRPALLPPGRRHSALSQWPLRLLARQPRHLRL